MKTSKFSATKIASILKEFEQGKITQDALKAERFRRFFDILDLDYDSVLFSKTFFLQIKANSQKIHKKTPIHFLRKN